VEKPVKVTGKVAYVISRSTGKKPRGIGVQFEGLSAETVQLLNVYLEDHISTILGR
jgi:Tfp pilus assembly protein PilZ